MLAKQLGSFVTVKLDHVLVGIVNNAGGLALYTVANDLASTIIEEIRTPISAAVYPVLAPHQHDRQLIARTFLMMFGAITTVAVATSLGINLVAQDIVMVALGRNWLPAVPLLQWLALSAGIFSIGALAFSIFELLGRADLSAKITWLNLLLIAGLMLGAALLSRDIVVISAARFGAFTIYSVVLLTAMLRLLPIGWRDLAVWAWRPVLAGALMAATVNWLQASFSGPGVVRLIVLSAGGALAYVAALAGLWLAAGRPDGPEALAIELFRSHRHAVSAHLLRLSWFWSRRSSHQQSG
jgi:PST family polysaccharide transporter